MIVGISSDAESDIAEGFQFYEEQERGLGDYFRGCIRADIDSLVFYAGIHEIAYGLHRMLTKSFPFTIYHKLHDNEATVVAVLDARRDPSWKRERLSSSVSSPKRCTFYHRASRTRSNAECEGRVSCNWPWHSIASAIDPPEPCHAASVESSALVHRPSMPSRQSSNGLAPK